MPERNESLDASADSESAFAPRPAEPRPQAMPEAAAADLDVGLDLGLASASFPVAAGATTTPRLPSALKARAVLRLQRQRGNFAVQRMLKRKPIQPGPNAQASPLKESTASEDDDWLARHIEGASGGGQPIEPQAQARLEAGLQRDLGDVRVHTDAEAAAMADAVQAVAFTSGRDIFFSQDAYQPGSSQGLELLAHETAHTVQQAAGPVAGAPAEGGVILSDPADPFEQAAEKVAEAVTSQPPIPDRPSSWPDSQARAGQSVQREELPLPESQDSKKLAAGAQPLAAAKPKKPEELA